MAARSAAGVASLGSTVALVAVGESGRGAPGIEGGLVGREYPSFAAKDRGRGGKGHQRTAVDLPSPVQYPTDFELWADFLYNLV